MSAADIKRLDRLINELYTMKIAPKYVDDGIEKLIKDQDELRAGLAKLQTEVALLQASLKVTSASHAQ